MSKLLTVNVNRKPCYDIMIEKDFFSLKQKLEEIGLTDRKCMIVSDSNVGPIYKDAMINELKDGCSDICYFEFKAGEENKNLSTVQELITQMIAKKFTRKDFILALGGGVTGDLAGFAASIYMRGIPFIQVPMRPIITRRKGLIAKAVQQIRAPATVTEVPMSNLQYLLKILARMSKPPVEALILKSMAWAALRMRTKHSRSNQGSCIMEVCPGSMSLLLGRISSQSLIIGPSTRAV